MRIRTTLLALSLLTGLLGAGLVARDANAAPTMSIQILKNSEFDKEHGVTSGDGTKAHPYVISGLELVNLQIENTSKWVEIKKNLISGTLLLDWVGGVKVHDNTIGNLVANRNVARTGMPTNGTIVHNRIDAVGQLRHWDGTFAYNTVGSKDKIQQQAANLDGFNGAKYFKNTFYGFVDARLHGHHFSHAFGMPSHHSHDYAHRYHQVSFTSNKIYAKHDYALAYLDSGHAGNDRTAPSETDAMLDEPHAHHTKVRFAGNKLVGAGVLVDVFNANDDHHVRTYKGRLEIEKNSISLARDNFFSAKQLMGIDMRNATDVTTVIKGNSVTGWKPNGVLAFLERWDTNAGILLQNVDKADVWIVNNSVANRHFGIHAMNFTVSTRWFIGSFRTSNVQERVASENVPRRAQAA